MENKKRKKQKEFVHISSILRKTLKGYRREPEGEQGKVWELWDGIVGKFIAENAQPAAFDGKILIVHVTDSTWTQQLHFHKTDIITKLNNVLGKELVEKIKFKIGPL